MIQTIKICYVKIPLEYMLTRKTKLFLYMQKKKYPQWYFYPLKCIHKQL